VAASHRDLRDAVASGRFREDLYFRLSVVPIEVPPLRDHLDDLPLLVDHFLRDLDAPPLGTESLATLARCAWPGNVRQLRNVLERAVALGAPAIIAEDVALPSAKEELLARFTHEYIEALVARHNGNVSAAAREAKIDRNWIVALAKRHGVRVRE